MQKDIVGETPHTGGPQVSLLRERLAAMGRSVVRPTGIVKVVMVLVAIGVVLGAIGALYETVPVNSNQAVYDYPEDWIYKWDVVKWINRQVDWVVVHGDAFFVGVRTVVLGILVPFRDFLLWVPWWLVIAGIAAVAWRAGSWRLAAVVTLFLSLMTVFGMMDLAMETLAIMFTATLLCAILGVPIGILAAASNRVDNAIRPILDGMQTMPSFVYLVPALMLFGLGMVPAVMATLIYAIPPIIRLTNLGIRQVDANVMEAARSFGTTRGQLLVKIQIPLALPTILAGLNQTVMMALAMTVLAAMVGAAGLGVEVLTGLGRINAGQGFIGGISIVFMAIILDRISQGFVKKPQVQPSG